MKTAYILIWVVSSILNRSGWASGVTTHSQEFTTQEACETVKKAIVEWKQNDTIVVTAYCFPK